MRNRLKCGVASTESESYRFMLLPVPEERRGSFDSVDTRKIEMEERRGDARIVLGRNSAPVRAAPASVVESRASEGKGRRRRNAVDVSDR